MTDLYEPDVPTVDPWPERRRRYFKDHPRRCAICDSPDVDLHHRRYNSPRGWEPDRDLVPLCKPHHRQVHRWHDKAARHDESPYVWLSLVTTVAIVVLRAHRFVRRPGVVYAVALALYWWAWWLAVLGLVVIVGVHLARRSQ